MAYCPASKDLFRYHVLWKSDQDHSSERGGCMPQGPAPASPGRDGDPARVPREPGDALHDEEPVPLRTRRPRRSGWPGVTPGPTRTSHRAPMSRNLTRTARRGRGSTT
jgi:hypothetical protein